jgi:hypothetical protein
MSIPLRYLTRTRQTLTAIAGLPKKGSTQHLFTFTPLSMSQRTDEHPCLLSPSGRFTWRDIRRRFLPNSNVYDFQHSLPASRKSSCQQLTISLWRLETMCPHLAPNGVTKWSWIGCVARGSGPRLQLGLPTRLDSTTSHKELPRLTASGGK